MIVRDLRQKWTDLQKDYEEEKVKKYNNHNATTNKYTKQMHRLHCIRNVFCVYGHQNCAVV